MPIEERRKKLMSSKHNWGDAWTGTSTGPSSHPPPPPAPVPADPEQPQANSESRSTPISPPDAITDMNRVVHPPKPNLFISSKAWSLQALVDSADNFREVPRESAFNLDLQSTITRYDNAGVPLIIDGWNEHPKWLSSFNIDWLRKNGQQTISARNVHGGNDKDLPLEEFIARSRTLPPFATPDESERLYGKDAHCPAEWSSQLCDFLPSSLLPDGPNNMLLHLPHAERVETLMCYLGIGDTFTACHKDLCGSSGQNIMCYTEKGGSSFWFMTESSAVPAVARYFHTLKQELDHETHVITVEQLRKAPFKVYIAEQKLGDMVLVPPRSCHQVVNYGGITIKTSWSRMTITGLSVAYYHELPIYRRVCRPETYRVKSTIYHALLYHITALEKVTPHASDTSPLPVSSSRDEPQIPTDKQRLARDLFRLTELFDDIIIEEYAAEHDSIPYLTSSSNAAQDGITCDFCGADVFHSFFECRDCVPLDSHATTDNVVGSGDGLVICPPCFVEGRSCECQRMSAMQRRPFKFLLLDRSRATKLLQRLQQDRTLGSTHMTLDEQELLSARHPGINRAACILQETRMHKKGTRQCRYSREVPSHEVPFDCAVICKKCRTAKCYLHTLQEQGVHAMEALLRTCEDATSESWHQRHNIKEFRNGAPKLLEDEVNGTRPVLTHKLVKTALDFGICKPVNPVVCLGWYDMEAQYHKAPTAQSDKATTEQDKDLIPMSPLTEYSSSAPSSMLSDVDSEISTIPLLDDDKPDNSSKQPSRTGRDSTQSKAKRKREVMEYVSIPSRREISVSKGSASASTSTSAHAPRHGKQGEEVEMTNEILADSSSPPSSSNAVTRIGHPRVERPVARRPRIASPVPRKRMIPVHAGSVDDQRPSKKVRIVPKESSEPQSSLSSGARHPQDATTVKAKNRTVAAGANNTEPELQFHRENSSLRRSLTSPRNTQETSLSQALNNSFENNTPTQMAVAGPSDARIVPKVKKGFERKGQAHEMELQEAKDQIKALEIAHEQEKKALRTRAEAAETKVIQLQDQIINANCGSSLTVNPIQFLELIERVGLRHQRDQSHGNTGPSNRGRGWDDHDPGIGSSSHRQPPTQPRAHMDGRLGRLSRLDRRDEPANHTYGWNGPGIGQNYIGSGQGRSRGEYGGGSRHGRQNNARFSKPAPHHSPNPGREGSTKTREPSSPSLSQHFDSYSPSRPDDNATHAQMRQFDEHSPEESPDDASEHWEAHGEQRREETEEQSPEGIHTTYSRQES